MPSAFKYQPRPQEAWDRRAKGSLFEGFALDEFQTFSPKKENSIRILPPTWLNPNHYGYDLWVHYGVGPSNATIICLYKMKNQKCPVCSAYERAEAQGREDAKELKPTRRVLVWLLDRKEEKQPLLWAMPWTVDRDISKICRDRKSGELYMIDNPDSGYDVSFDKEGEGMTTKYTGFQLDRRPSPVDSKWIDYILAHPLPDTLMWRTGEEVQALFEGLAPDIGTSAPPPQEESQSPVQQTAPPPPAPSKAPPPPVAAAPPPPPPPKPFVSEWTNTDCSVCGKPQYTVPTGVTCEGGHEETGGVKKANGQSSVTVMTPAQPTIARSTTTDASSAASKLRARFDTGNK